MRAKTVAVSGGFDPLHAGHLQLLADARRYGEVVVILNTDDWLRRKKGFIFQTWEDRAALLSALAGVAKVVKAIDDTDTVCASLKDLKPDYFVNGGDRKPDNTPETELCARLGITTVFNADAQKLNHSSVIGRLARVSRDWGYYEVLIDEPDYKVKLLTVFPESATSKQFHRHRREDWHVLEGGVVAMVNGDEYNLGFGDSVRVADHQIHQVINIDKGNAKLLEIQTGTCLENDIVRLDT